MDHVGTAGLKEVADVFIFFVVVCIINLVWKVQEIKDVMHSKISSCSLFLQLTFSFLLFF